MGWRIGTCCATLVIALSGCAATQVVTNDKPSDLVKAKRAGDYREILLLPPKEDGREIAPLLAEELQKAGFKVTVLDPSQPIESSQGSGFVIDPSGLVLTCAHVVGDQKQATLTFGKERLVADVLRSDAKADLALLKVREPLPRDVVAMRFRPPPAPAVLGEEVTTLGYPMSRMLGNGVRLTRGLVSAESGLRDDANQMQISAEVQPGNSGGPLLDREGRVVGVVVATIDPGMVARTTGTLPQNVNFAIKEEPVLDFLAAEDPRIAASVVRAAPSSGGLAGLDKGVAKVQAGIVGPDAERHDKLLVRFAYQSFWDIYFRFRYFILSAVDFDTLETLFVLGQTRPALLSTEGSVVRQDVEKFKAELAKR